MGDTKDVKDKQAANPNPVASTLSIPLANTKNPYTLSKPTNPAPNILLTELSPIRISLHLVAPLLLSSGYEKNSLSSGCIRCLFAVHLLQ